MQLVYSVLHCAGAHARSVFICVLAAASTALADQHAPVDCARHADATTAKPQTPQAQLDEVRCLVAARRHGAALLVLERVLVVEPQNREALALRSRILASLELRRPERDAALHAPATGELSGQEWMWRRAWIAGTLGFDSNANSGTDAIQISLPLFRDAVLDIQDKLGDLRRRASPVTGLSAGFGIRDTLDERSELRVSGTAVARYNSRVAAYLPHDYWLGAEVDRRLGSFRPTLYMETVQRLIGRYRTVDASTLGARAEMLAPARLRIAPFVDATRKRLPVLDGLTMSERRYGLAIGHYALPLRLTVLSGRERSVDTRRYLDRDYAGFSLGWTARAGESTLLQLACEETRSRYVEYSQLFLGHRVDRFRELRIVLERRLPDAWFLTPQLVLQQNRSNIVLTSFARQQVLFELRREY